MKFRYLTVFVSDLQQTLAFYEEALALRAAFVHDSGRYAELATGDTKLAFAEHTLARAVVGAPYAEASPERPPPGFEIGLRRRRRPRGVRARDQGGRRRGQAADEDAVGPDRRLRARSGRAPRRARRGRLTARRATSPRRRLRP
jgi:catechol 2,3-dioxygenase-like lactoylglutathione lyase family enzyme